LNAVDLGGYTFTIDAMAGFDENIVREYFEWNGFLVRQLRKYSVQSVKKLSGGETTMMVYNPAAPANSALRNFQLFSADMATIRQAIVVVKGWHRSRFTPAILKSSAKLYNFLKKDVISQADSYFNLATSAGEPEQINESAEYAKILVLPGLPTSEPQRSESIALLKECGVDGIVAFSTILESLLRQVEVNHSYQKSELLQLMRVLKMYDMVKDPQLTLFQ
jgi:hypothetical protein